MDKITQKAYAKINLGLDVLSRRADGYHLVKMIMQTVDLYDLLTIEKTDEPGIRFKLLQDGKAVTTLVPEDDTNLVCKAARKLMEKTGRNLGVSFTLQKNIPVAAGMAGGSTDAAAALTGMNQLFALGLSDEELREIAVTIGADVPYCIRGGTALSEGIGEILTLLPSPPQVPLVIVKPDVSVSTKSVYENLHVESLQRHPDIDGMIEAIKKGDLTGMTDRMENVLETVTIALHPVIAKIKRLLEKQGAKKALMSGSGPTVFAVFEEEEKADAAAKALAKTGCRVIRTTFVNPT